MVSSLRACDVIHLASQQRTRISVSDLGTGQAQKPKACPLPSWGPAIV